MQSLKRIKINAKRSMMKLVIKCEVKTGCFCLYIALCYCAMGIVISKQSSVLVTCPSNLPTRQIYELTIIFKLTKQHEALYIVKFYTVGLLIHFPLSSKYRKLFCYTWRYTFFFCLRLQYGFAWWCLQ